MFAIESGIHRLKIHSPRIFFSKVVRPSKRDDDFLYKRRSSLFTKRGHLRWDYVCFSTRSNSFLGPHPCCNELRSLKHKKQAKIPRLNQITFLARQRTNKCKYREYVPPHTLGPPAPRILNFIWMIKTVALTLQNQIVLLRSQRSLQFLISSQTAKAIKSSH